ncbi:MULTISPECIES: peptidoglycan-associated lipoprotein Pal [Marinobacter]|jgi:peptidoglycan-associated lipoprotein|uniref:peptidoglycan-associated lipoprotein Pal n=1 Tax=Marinobacter TaxID=2742 RepID=UPI002006B609|nr:MULTISPECIES: peptidoglycan-associated lipoprotein Pal [Marinobacter]MCK7549977.1 peptidoglycan-associated lipoprotein Pal [Marinobacter goseongensis]MDV3503445.1 peptidoglycan-associated lipoprotein Pal [Marinobacter sp. M-5]
MKITAHQKAFAMVLSLGLVAGCSSTGDTMEDGAYGSDVEAVDQDGGSTVYGGGDRDGVSSSDLTDEELREREERAEQEAMRNITTFYFDFDTAEIKPEAREVLVAHARYLENNPNQQVRLEGHADERGTKEYNLALGERRANAVERFLIVNGASRGQMETVSYGEEKPAVMGSDESALAQNRRVELVFE